MAASAGDRKNLVNDSHVARQLSVRAKRRRFKSHESRSSDVFNKLQRQNARKVSLCRQMWEYNFHPSGKFHTFWDVFIFFLVMFSTIWVPFRVAFHPDQNSDGLETAVDVFFLLDIVITFWSGFVRGYEVVMDKKEIAKEYAKTWLLVDIISTIDMNAFLQLFGYESGSRSVELLRLLKVGRLAKVGRLIERMTAKWTVHTGIIDATKFLVLILTVAHLLACFFFLVPTLFDDCLDKTLRCTWRGVYNTENMNPSEQYLESMHWALQTMTTLGYGDRVPQTHTEILYVMFAEVFGLAVFAMLLDQINKLSDVMNEEQHNFNETKNHVVAFLKRNLLPTSLQQNVIAYLHFKTHSISGRYFRDDDPRFTHLSLPMRQQIRREIFVPILKGVRVFGWHPEDLEEQKGIKQTFDATDLDGGGTLDLSEFAVLVRTLGMEMNSLEVKKAMEEIGTNSTGEFTFEEFQDWWMIHRFGIPVVPTVPEQFLGRLVDIMEVEAWAPEENIISTGEYGENLYIVLKGTVAVNITFPGGSQTKELQLVQSDDRAPFLGLMAALSDQWLDSTAPTRQWWECRARTFSDVAKFPRHKIIRALVEHWPEGAESFDTIAKFYYARNLRDESQSRAGSLSVRYFEVSSRRLRERSFVVSSKEPQALTPRSHYNAETSQDGANKTAVVELMALPGMSTDEGTSILRRTKSGPGGMGKTLKDITSRSSSSKLLVHSKSNEKENLGKPIFVGPALGSPVPLKSVKTFSDKDVESLGAMVGYLGSSLSSLLVPETGLPNDTHLQPGGQGESNNAFSSPQGATSKPKRRSILVGPDGKRQSIVMSRQHRNKSTILSKKGSAQSLSKRHSLMVKEKAIAETNCSTEDEDSDDEVVDMETVVRQVRDEVKSHIEKHVAKQTKPLATRLERIEDLLLQLSTKIDGKK